MSSRPSGNRYVGYLLLAAAICFWTSWALMPGVGVTDAATILMLVGAQPEKVLASSVLQLISAALLAMTIPGLALQFANSSSVLGKISLSLLAVGACGDAADAIYHQLAFEMVRPGVDRAAMLPIMQRMQSADLLYLLPMILAFLLGCFALSVSASRQGIVSRWNPLLYVFSVATGAFSNGLSISLGIPSRVIGLVCLGFLSVSLGWIGIALMKLRTAPESNLAAVMVVI